MKKLFTEVVESITPTTPRSVYAKSKLQEELKELYVLHNTLNMMSEEDDEFVKYARKFLEELSDVDYFGSALLHYHGEDESSDLSMKFEAAITNAIGYYVNLLAPEIATHVQLVDNVIRRVREIMSYFIATKSNLHYTTQYFFEFVTEIQKETGLEELYDIVADVNGSVQ